MDVGVDRSCHVQERALSEGRDRESGSICELAVKSCFDIVGNRASRAADRQINSFKNECVRHSAGKDVSGIDGQAFEMDEYKCSIVLCMSEIIAIQIHKHLRHVKGKP